MTYPVKKVLEVSKKKKKPIKHLFPKYKLLPFVPNNFKVTCFPRRYRCGKTGIYKAHMFGSPSPYECLGLTSGSCGWYMRGP